MPKVKIHETAEVNKDAKIGEGTAIWQNSQVFAGAEIGKNCTIGHNCFISGKAKLGEGVKIESNTDVWDLVTLEDYVFVGPSAVFTNDPNPRAKYPKRDYPQHGKWLATLVKEGASLGANSTIVCGVKVGKWSFVGAGSVVTKDVPNFALVVGVPARIIGWVCECGNKIEFKDEKTICKVCKREYIKKGDKVKKIK
ncbi:MAG: acyltransferase [Candidatus Pacebacteria bacterium]|nr:acyltransferase [Candidatus Paceibacterota bacterium]